MVYLHHVQHAHRNRERQTELSMGGQTELTAWLPLPDVHSALGMPQEAIRAHRGMHQLYQQAWVISTTLLIKLLNKGDDQVQGNISLSFSPSFFI